MCLVLFYLVFVCMLFVTLFLGPIVLSFLSLIHLFVELYGIFVE